MSRFNVVTNANQSGKTTNRAGGEAYSFSPEYKLYTLACNSILQDTYYRTASDELRTVEALVKAADPEYVSNLAAYARNEMNLRSMPVVLATLLARHHGDKVARRTVSRVVKRVDEITELLGYFGTINDKAGNKAKGAHSIRKLIKARPNSLLRGIKDVFESGRFDEYQFGKYDRKGTFTLRDALFLSHAKPRSTEQATLFKKIAERTLETPYTWEVELSKAGSDAAKKLEVWTRLIQSGRLGHMALLRNLRNILALKPTQELVSEICERLVKGAPNGKQFPVRYWTAFRALVENMPRRDHSGSGRVKTVEGIDPFHLQTVEKALGECLKVSLRNIPQLGGRNLVACDASGSMFTPVSAKGQLARFEVGFVLGSAFAATQPTVVGMFGDTWKTLTLSGNPIHDTMAMYMREGEVGYSTNGYLVLEWALKNQLSFDNILMFTDCQLYGGSMQDLWHRYKAVNSKARLWLFDLAGLGDSPLKITEKDTFLVSGWSDKIFDAADRLSKGESIVNQIRAYSEVPATVHEATEVKEEETSDAEESA